MTERDKLRKKKSPELINFILLIVFIIYVIIVLHITLFSRMPSTRRCMLTPFWEYKELIYNADKFYWLGQIIGNIVMFIPLGVFLCRINRRLSVVHIGIIGFVFSAFIELTQLLTGRGLLEFDDIFHNTLGAVIGYFIINNSFFSKRKK